MGFNSGFKGLNGLRNSNPAFRGRER